MTQESLPYRDLLHLARQISRRADEAEDLLQAALLTAVEQGRADLSCPTNRRWLGGVLRNRARFEARSAVRRREREHTAPQEPSDGPSEVSAAAFVRSLPKSLRLTALLALTGHNKTDMAWLLRVSDSTLRQRIHQLKKRWAEEGLSGVTPLGGLTGDLDYGQIRKALLQPSRRDGVALATHDPDGHLFVVTSQNAQPRQLGVATRPHEE